MITQLGCLGAVPLIFAMRTAVAQPPHHHTETSPFVFMISSTGGHMNANRETERQDSLTAARAALLILRASVDSRADKWVVRFGDAQNEMPVNDEGAVGWLTALEKPVQCIAEEVDSATARLNCRTATSEERALIRRRSTEFEHGTGFYSDFAPFLAWRSRAHVSLRGRSQRMNLSIDEFEALVRSYDIGGRSTLGIRLETLTEGDATHTVIVEAGRVEEYNGPIPPR